MLAPDDDVRPARAKLALEVARVVERGALEQLLGRLTETVVVLRIAMKHGRSLARAVRHPGSPPACSLARDGTPTPSTAALQRQPASPRAEGSGRTSLPA